MNRRDFFEVACALLGIYFIVSAFSTVPFLLLYPRLQHEAILRQVLIWLSPFIYVLAGLCLLAKRRALAGALFPGETEKELSDQTSRSSKHFEVGAKLLGLYFIVHSLPSAARLVADVKEKGADGLDLRGSLATILVLVVSLVMALKGDWLADLLCSDATSPSDSPMAGDDARQQSGSEEGPRE